MNRTSLLKSDLTRLITHCQGRIQLWGQTDWQAVIAIFFYSYHTHITISLTSWMSADQKQKCSKFKATVISQLPAGTAGKLGKVVLLLTWSDTWLVSRNPLALGGEVCSSIREVEVAFNFISELNVQNRMILYFCKFRIMVNSKFVLCKIVCVFACVRF